MYLPIIPVHVYNHLDARIIDEILSQFQINDHNMDDDSTSPKLNKKSFPNSSTSQTTENFKTMSNKSYTPFLESRNNPTKYIPAPAECAVTSIAPHHREVITVRTPLPHNDQESCV